MTEEDRKEVTKYLKSIDVRSMEFFEEMYDHILSSYQARVNKNQTITDHIRDVIQPAFGGVKGIQRVMKAQQKLRRKAVFKRAKQLFLSYLISWPTVLITAVITLAIIQLNIIFGTKSILLIVMTSGALVPAGFAISGKIKFYFNCKRINKPYTSSDLNRQLISVAIIGTNMMNVLLFLVRSFIGEHEMKSFDALSASPWTQMTLSVFFILYALVVIQLLKEKFIFKLAQ